MPRTLRLTLTLLLIAGSLAACGKRGQLEPPSAQKQASETGSPAPSAASTKAGDDKAGEDGAGQNKLGGKKRVPITPPKRELFIDRLLD